MKNLFTLFVSLLLPTLAFAEAIPGKPAPDFKVVDAAGKEHKLADYKGKWLVLEWTNKDCPFVKKHYGAENMQKLQKDAAAKGAVWLSVLSSAKGKQGYMEAKEAMEQRKSVGASAPLLLDASGAMGKAYGAKTTPHMFVIDPKGMVAYAGAIDSDSSPKAEAIPGATNYVSEALNAGMAKPAKTIATTSTQAYGCGVKY